MLADRATQLDAEEETSGYPSVWREIYALFRCPGSLCDIGPYCWQDPNSKKRYKLRILHLKGIIDWVERGHLVESHDDVPDNIREQLVTEEQQRLKRQPDVPANAPTPFPPINITNVSRPLPTSHLLPVPWNPQHSQKQAAVISARSTSQASVIKLSSSIANGSSQKLPEKFSK